MGFDKFNFFLCFNILFLFLIVKLHNN